MCSTALERTEATGSDRAGAATGPFRLHPRRVPVGALRVAHHQPPVPAPRRARRGARDRGPGGPVSAELARHACLAGPRFDPVGRRRPRPPGRRTPPRMPPTTARRRRTTGVRSRRSTSCPTPTIAPGWTCRSASVPRSSSSATQTAETILRAAAQTAHRRADPVALARAVCSMVSVPGGSTSPGPADQSVRSLAEAALEVLPASDGGVARPDSSAPRPAALLTDAPDRGTAMIACRRGRRPPARRPGHTRPDVLPYRSILRRPHGHGPATGVRTGADRAR